MGITVPLNTMGLLLLRAWLLSTSNMLLCARTGPVLTHYDMFIGILQKPGQYLQPGHLQESYLPRKNIICYTEKSKIGFNQSHSLQTDEEVTKHIHQRDQQWARTDTRVRFVGRWTDIQTTSNDVSNRPLLVSLVNMLRQSEYPSSVWRTYIYEVGPKYSRCRKRRIDIDPTSAD